MITKIMLSLPPPQIEDRSTAMSDVDDFNSFLSSYKVDHLQLKLMHAQEVHYQISADYLSSSSATVTTADRHALCTWSYQIIDSMSSMKITREIACIGMSYLDRFMATSSTRAQVALRSTHEYQLATVVCTVIAIKNHGGITLGTNFVADDVCHGLYTNDELDVMEMEILQALTWRLNGPSPHEFIDAVVGLLPASSVDGGAASLLLSKQSKVNVETAVLDYDLALQSSSSLAYAAILTTFQTSSNVRNGFEPTDLIDWMSNTSQSRVMAGGSAQGM